MEPASALEASPPGFAMCRVPGRDDCTFLLLRNGGIAASMRTTTATASRRELLPAMKVFGREIDVTIGREATIVEASQIMVNATLERESRVPLVHLLKGPMIECAAQDAEWLLAAVHEDEIGFYRRVLNMEILSGAETYPGAALPRVLMGLRYREQAGLVFKRIPVLAVTPEEVLDYSTSGIVRFHTDVSRHHAA